MYHFVAVLIILIFFCIMLKCELWRIGTDTQVRFLKRVYCRGVDMGIYPFTYYFLLVVIQFYVFYFVSVKIIKLYTIYVSQLNKE